MNEVEVFKINSRRIIDRMDNARRVRKKGAALSAAPFLNYPISN